MVRAALRMFLEQSTTLKVCGEAADGSEAVAKARELRPSLVLLDLSMPNMNGAEAASIIHSILPDTRIVVFTLYSDFVGRAMARAAGVDLLVEKTEGATGLLKALQPYLADAAIPPA